MPKGRTELVPVTSLRVGDVFVESANDAARVFRVGASGRRVFVRARYVWTPDSEPTWPIDFDRDEYIWKAI